MTETHGTSKPSSMSIPLFSLLLGGVTMSFAGKQPDILYFDVVFFLWIVYQVYWKGFWPDFSGATIRLALFCIFVALLSTLVNSADFYRSIAATKVLAVGFLVYAVSRRAFLGLVVPSLFGACGSLSLIQNYQAVRYGVYEGVAGLKDEIGSALGRSNYAASVLILLIPLAIAGACSKKGMPRWLLISCAMLMCSGLIITMSRGAMLAIVGATLLSCRLLFKAGIKIRHGILTLSLLVLTIVFTPTDLLKTNIALFAYRLATPDFTREEIMRASWNVFRENPLVGVGPGQLGAAINTHLVVPPYAVRYYNAHNLILDSVAELGLPAGLALLLAVALVLKTAWSAAINQPSALNLAIWIGLLAAVMHNMVEASFEGQQFQVVFWAVAGMAGRAPISSTNVPL